MTARDPRTVDYIYRQNTPPGYKGRPCRMLALAPRTRDGMNIPIVNTGSCIVAIQFTDTGEKMLSQRQAFAPVGSKAANQAISVAADPRSKSERASAIKKKRMDRTKKGSGA